MNRNTDNSHLPRGRSSGRQRPALSPLWMKYTLIVPSPRVRDSVHSYRESHLGPHSPRNPLHPRHSFELCQFLSTSIHFPPCITEHPRSQGTFCKRTPLSQRQRVSDAWPCPSALVVPPFTPLHSCSIR
ncbi:hypothetical protein FA13DRAFT_812755 [Coprinellus micaceus]|uniref:Uncharacterized protein n=1 Tax=Coprinellus micaceus TaxID=71717 RepID=A0A4Y7S530_COPMI|nr:hypothetical protein FA13DRAFT_812755 [Coprinellus micaceus]